MTASKRISVERKVLSVRYAGFYVLETLFMGRFGGDVQHAKKNDPWLIRTLSVQPGELP
jgi:hypothetical protein